MAQYSPHHPSSAKRCCIIPSYVCWCCSCSPERWWKKITIICRGCWCFSVYRKRASQTPVAVRLSNSATIAMESDGAKINWYDSRCRNRQLVLWVLWKCIWYYHTLMELYACLYININSSIWPQPSRCLVRQWTLRALDDHRRAWVPIKMRTRPSDCPTEARAKWVMTWWLHRALGDNDTISEIQCYFSV